MRITLGCNEGLLRARLRALDAGIIRKQRLDVKLEGCPH